MKLRFDYTPTLGLHGKTDRQPLVDVVFTNPKNGKHVEVRCLIDSGAAYTIIHAALAESLGLDLRAGVQHPFSGIAGDPVIAYDHRLMLQLKNDTHKYAAEASLLPGLNVTGLLGRNGFFDHYKVVFEQYHKRFELTPQPNE